MELKDFIKNVLVDISTAIEESQDVLSQKACVAPWSQVATVPLASEQVTDMQKSAILILMLLSPLNQRTEHRQKQKVESKCWM